MSLSSVAAAPWASSGLSISTFADSYICYQQSGGSLAWGTANRAIYVPVRVPKRVTVQEMAVSSGATGTGNIDMGIYNEAGTRLGSTGSTVKLAAAELQVAALTAATTIGPGTYYLALNNDTTTDTFHLISAFTAPLSTGFGILTEALGSVTLPATASWAFDNALDRIPNVAAVMITELA